MCSKVNPLLSLFSFFFSDGGALSCIQPNCGAACSDSSGSPADAWCKGSTSCTKCKKRLHYNSLFSYSAARYCELKTNHIPSLCSFLIDTGKFDTNYNTNVCLPPTCGEPCFSHAGCDPNGGCTLCKFRHYCSLFPYSIARLFISITYNVPLHVSTQSSQAPMTVLVLVQTYA